MYENNHKILSSAFHNFFTPVVEVHHYNTRSASKAALISLELQQIMVSLAWDI